MVVNAVLLLNCDTQKYYLYKLITEEGHTVQNYAVPFVTIQCTTEQCYVIDTRCLEPETRLSSPAIMFSYKSLHCTVTNHCTEL